MRKVRQLSCFYLLISFFALLVCMSARATANNQQSLQESLTVAAQYYDQGRPEAVIATLTPIAEQHPNASKPAWMLFASYTALGLFEQAKPWLQRTIEQDASLPHSMWATFYFLQGDNRALADIIKRYREAPPSATAEDYKNMAIPAAAAGHYKAAHSFFNQAKRLQQAPFLNLHYAHTLQQLGEPERAAHLIIKREQGILKRLEEQPNDPFALYVMAEIHALRGEAEQSVNFLRRAVKRQQPFYLYWSLSEASLGDSLWQKVRQHPSFRDFLKEKQQQRLTSLAKLRGQNNKKVREN